uniref:Related to INP52-phosphatidylinositol phosphate phosphatase n=1 Tax=Melanopsichium pennsylvanicum 4 TaxID=1398559 RepID=A0A077QTD2_9BASI|nr:related to INP52-phosphatidylinositol phosphate phosphatase [Melanopsichium pennsylvanicum 4]
MSASVEPYHLASTLLTPDELPKLALITYDADSYDDYSNNPSSSSPTPPLHTQRIFVIVSNVSFGVEQSCVLIIKPRRKDPSTASLISAIPILPDLKIEIEPQQGLTASAAMPRNHVPTAMTLGLSSLPHTLPTIHSLLESVVPDLFSAEKAETSNAALNFTLSHGSQTASGVTSDARGLKDFLIVLKELVKVAQEHSFSADTLHDWMKEYTEDIGSNYHYHQHHRESDPSHLDTCMFSRFSNSAFLPAQAPQSRPIQRPASPTVNDVRLSVGTFNVNNQLPPENDIPTLIGLKNFIRAEQEPDLIVIGLQEVDTSGGAYLYYSPAREEAWTRAFTQALGRRANMYRKLASKQLVGLMILVFVRTELENSVSELATASVGVGLGGFVANKGAVAVRLKIGQRSMCFVNSHLSAMEGLQAMERRCWDWNEIYKRLRFRLASVKMDNFWEIPVIEEAQANGGSDVGNSSKEEPTNRFKIVKNNKEEARSNSSDAKEGYKSILDETFSNKVQQVSKNKHEKDEQENLPPLVIASKKHETTTTKDDSEAVHVNVTSAWRPSPDSEDSHISSNNMEHAIMDHDLILHLGDLNFRLDLSHSEAHRLIRSRQYDILYRYDQLGSLRTSGSLFDDFEEGKINFAPTYKFDKGTDRYDTSDKQRIPAWTDRILWAVTQEWEDDGGLNSATAETKFAYESVPNIKFSDHRPVRATLLIRIR